MKKRRIIKRIFIIAGAAAAVIYLIAVNIAVNAAFQIRGGYDIRKAAAKNSVEKSSIPLLFIHGDKDDIVPLQMAQDMYERAECLKALVITEGAGHAQSRNKDPELYYGSIEKFLTNVRVSEL